MTKGSSAVRLERPEALHLHQTEGHEEEGALKSPPSRKVSASTGEERQTEQRQGNHRLIAARN